MDRRKTFGPVRFWVGLWIAVTLALLWPAAINGGPFWFPDTGSYIRGADAAVVVLTGERSEWSDRLQEVPVVSAGLSDNDQDRIIGTRIVPERPVLTNRSVYYGMLLYLPIRILGSWGALALQALLISTGLLFCLAVLARGRAAPTRRTIAAIAAAMVVLSPLPYYTCMLMPDVWSGMLVALLGLAICLKKRLSRSEYFALLLVTGIIATFHTTHILLAVSLVIAALLVRRNWADRARGAAAAITVAFIGFASIAVFSAAIEARLGQKPLSPPFLSARLSDSGPGIAYLQAHCAQAPQAERFALCAYRDRLPLNSDNFLWSEQPRNGLFQLVPPDVQRRIAEEDKRFFLAVAFDDPLTYAASVAQATVNTLFEFDLKNFNYAPVRIEALDERYPPAVVEQVVWSKAAQNTMPTDFTVAMTIAASVAALALIPVLMWKRSRSGASFLASDTMAYALTALLGILANAAICGAFSKPDARYHMRLIWLLPFAAGITAIVRSEQDGCANEQQSR